MSSMLVLLSLLVLAPEPVTRDGPLVLSGGRVVVSAGMEPLEEADVVLRDGRIEAVGAAVDWPYDARVLDVAGLTITPAFVDAAHELELAFPDHAAHQGREADDGRDVFAGMLDANRRGLAPEREAWRALAQDAADRDDDRRAGFGAVLVSPGHWLLSGYGAWLALSSLPPREAILEDRVAQFGSLEWRSNQEESYEGTDYPATLMGVMAHLRQVLLDAQHRALVADRHAAGRSGRRPAQDPALKALQPVLEGVVPLVVVAQVEEDIRLALGLAEDFPGLDLVIAGGREAWEVADLLAERGVSVVLELDFPDEPDDLDAEDEEGDEDERDTGRGPYDPPVPERIARHLHDEWVEQVSGAARLLEAGVTVAAGSFGRDPADLREDLALAVEHGGLSAADALGLVTTGARRIFGGGAPEGELLPGGIGSVAVWDGEPTDDESELRLVVVDGVLFDFRDEADESKDDSDEEEDSDAEEEPSEESAEDEPAPDEEPVDEEDDADEDEGDEGEGEDDEPSTPYRAGLVAALADADADVTWPVELDEDREPSFRTGGDVVVRNATILTASHGTIEDGDLVVEDGKITAVGSDLSAPAGAREIDASGRFVIPGIIDCHAHCAIRGGINEWTRIVTPEVTIEDEVNPDDVAIYRALAGGATAARLLHGSANVIGGRHEVVKFRWGVTAPEMVLEGAPRGVKFALGENPRQANWGSGGRFPKTRMGVEATLRRSFHEARRYVDGWERFARAEAAGEDPDPPRRDLRLEALAGILSGDIAVHSHCYRAHEILMLMGIAEEFGFRVATFQHVLEGYKVAAELAAHGGLGGSTFVDWWGFKFEAYDATPYNAALVHEAGAWMSVNSDSNDHLRRLYLEAAKTVKYGGVPEEDALRMVTVAPAVQLGIDEMVGSLEVGKDGDFAIFSHHPFDVRTRCLMTFVDGELMFERRDGVYDDWADEIDRRVAAGRLAMESAPDRPEPTPVEAHARVDEGALDALSLPRNGTGAPSTPERPSPPPLALVGGTIHTMGAEGVINTGTVLIRDGRIEKVREGLVVHAVLEREGYEVRDVTGRHVWPGIVDGGGRVGLGEIALVRQSMDTREIGGHQADLRTSTAWHPASDQIPVTRVNGITSALVVPQGSGILGQSSLMAMEGWTASDALITDAVALHVQAPRVSREEKDDEDGPGHAHACDWIGAAPPVPVPAGPKGKGRGKDALADRVDEAWERIRDQLLDAREYARVVGGAASRGEAGPDYDPRLEALAPYALGLAPIVFHANGADQIADVLDFADEHGLDAIVAGGKDAWKVADRLALADVPVLVGQVLTLPSSRDDPYDAPFANAGLLHRAGVRIGFRSDSSWSTRDLPYHAGMAVAFGLDEDVAMHALTAGTADILGVGEQLGRLAPGHRADVIVTDGSPLQITTRLELILVGGRDVGLESKHTRLYERYRGRLHAPGRATR